jgi:hypothetical protein
MKAWPARSELHGRRGAGGLPRLPLDQGDDRLIHADHVAAVLAARDALKRSLVLGPVAG